MNKLLEKAYLFAEKAHSGQFRKYHESKVPYFEHVKRVATKVSEQLDSTDKMIAAAVLHDVIEDCNVSKTELLEKFGSEVAALVDELTNKSKGMKKPDGSNYNRAERKEIDRNRLKNSSAQAKLIKLCDRIDNLNDMINAPKDFINVYCKESKSLLDVLRGTSPELEQELESIIKGLESKNVS